MLSCDKYGKCSDMDDEGELADLVESLAPGTPFSAFLLAAEMCICFVLLASVPNTRKDTVFGFLAIIFAPFFVKTVVEVAFFVAIYFYTSSYSFWSWVHDSVVSSCYSSFLFNFEYGIVVYSVQCWSIVVRKKTISKLAQRIPYVFLFILTLLQTFFFWKLMGVGIIAVLLILILAPLGILAILFAACCCKTDSFSEHEEVRKAKSRMLWNIPCLLLAMTDSALNFYLTLRHDSYKYNLFYKKEVIFSVLFPACATIIVLLTLSASRRAIFPCCYDHNAPQSDRMFLLTRDSVSGCPSPSERSSVTAIANNAVVPYPNTVVPTPYNNMTPVYPIMPMPTGYPGYPSGYPSGFPQGQPVFFPVPMTFFNPNQMPARQNELPVVQ